MPPTKMRFEAKTLRKILEQKGIMEFVLARRLGLTKSALSRKMNGTRKWRPEEIQGALDLINMPRGAERKIFPEMFE
jgi:hypothetical protein